MKYEIVVGIEVHAQLKTRSKLFCGCATTFGSSENSQTCPVCLGHPGVLPVLNREAFDLALRAAIALDCRVAETTTFDRKNYYYPDLPKNYQISQLYENLGVDGHLDIEAGEEVRRIRIHNVHLEEDAGKLLHPEGSGHTLVDLNRAGTPLLEIVTQPDMRSLEEADAFMRGLRDLLRHTDVSDCRMEEGSLRFEASISLRRPGETALGSRVEVKNLNSMRAVRRSLEHEVSRQTAILDAGGTVDRETRLWNDEAGRSERMRTKELAHDYRYFPEPDLPPCTVTPERIEAIRASLPELPLEKARRFMKQYGLGRYDAGVLSADPAVSAYFEEVIRLGASPKAACNWTANEILSALHEEGIAIEEFPVRPEALTELIAMVESGEVNVPAARETLREMRRTGTAPAAIVKEKGLAQVSGEEAIRALVEKAIASLPKAAEDLRSGKGKARGALVGFVMRESKGKANPAVVNKIIDALLKG